MYHYSSLNIWMAIIQCCLLFLWNDLFCSIKINIKNIIANLRFYIVYVIKKFVYVFGNINIKLIYL